MVLDAELKLTDDCIVRLSEVKQYVDEKLINISGISASLILKNEVQDMLLDLYQILDRDIL